MSLRKEYSNSSVSGGGCSYATLTNYNANYNGRGTAPASLAAANAYNSSEVVAIPSFGGPGYNVFLSQKDPVCGGYNKMNTAYPGYPNCRR
jgi:hypothetical protein